jgi:hypothetical protein
LLPGWYLFITVGGNRRDLCLLKNGSVEQFDLEGVESRAIVLSRIPFASCCPKLPALLLVIAGRLSPPWSPEPFVIGAAAAHPIVWHSGYQFRSTARRLRPPIK